MRTTASVVCVSLALLSACAMTPQQMAQMSDADLCKRYGNTQNEQIKTELQRRNVLTPTEWSLVDQKKIKIGMSETAFLCSWGSASTVNSTVTSGGASRQYVFRSCNTCKANYVYTRNGVVTSWQD